MRAYRVMPKRPKVRTVEEPDASHMAIAEAVRAACLPFVSMTRTSDVEHMDLRSIVIRVLSEMAHLSDHERDLMRTRLEEGRY